jgi:5'-nucleotidase
MYFDDQRSHLKSEAGDIPMVHIPFGIANKDVEQTTAGGLITAAQRSQGT